MALPCAAASGTENQGHTPRDLSVHGSGGASDPKLASHARPRPVSVAGGAARYDPALGLDRLLHAGRPQDPRAARGLDRLVGDQVGARPRDRRVRRGRRGNPPAPQAPAPAAPRRPRRAGADGAGARARGRSEFRAKPHLAWQLELAVGNQPRTGSRRPARRR